MTPVYQTIHDQDDGNCFSASLASILELPLAAVPNFAKEYGDDWERAASDWLAAQGKRFLTIGFAYQEMYERTYFDNAGEYCIVSGPSDYPDRGHAVVGKVEDDGIISVVHDPNGGQGPLPGHRWVRFIVPTATESHP